MSGSLLGIGISALQTNKQQLATVGHNISNAATPGYSRQEVITHASNPTDIGVGYIGNGVESTQIRRMVDDFVTAEVRENTFNFKGLETYQNKVEQIDRLVADDRTGLAPALNEFFAAAQSAADNPSYIPTRAVLLGEAQSLADRFNTIAKKLDDHNVTINGQVSSLAGEVNTIAAGIAELNKQITYLSGNDLVRTPNDLLDQRDELVRSLAEKIDIDVVDNDGSFDIYMGSGQALVLQFQASQLEIVAGEDDPYQKDIMFVSPVERRNITDDITGGQLGGMLTFRDEMLNTSMNALGRIAVAVSSEINQQHKLGLDLDGEFGQDIFQDLNADHLVSKRAFFDVNNAPPNDRIVSVYIEDTQELTTSDYLLEFTGPKDFEYQIKNLSDNSLVKEGVFDGGFPYEIQFDGLNVKLEAGSYQAGDNIRIKPLKDAATDFKLVAQSPAEIALAMPVLANTSLGNTGSGLIDQGEMLSTQTTLFQQPGQLSPPLVVVFDEPTRYSIYDNSDPLNPKSLSPPQEGLAFVPGTSNPLFAADNGATQLSSFRGPITSQAFIQRAGDVVTQPENGFNPERVFISRTDPISGVVEQDPTISIAKGSSAQEVAGQLNTVKGVSARASTTATLSGFTSGTPPYAPSNPMDIWVNDVEITLDDLGVSQSLFEQGFEETVPDPMTADFVANRINHNFALQGQGISAKSDGDQVTIMQNEGGDIAIEMRGDRSDPSLSVPGDSFQVGNAEQIRLQSTGAQTRGLLSAKAGFDFSSEGPYQYDFEVDTVGELSITLEGNHSTGEDVIAEIEQKIAQQLPFSANVNASISATGDISFAVTQTLQGWSNNDSEKITIGGKLDVVLDEGVSLSTEPPFGNLFAKDPQALSMFPGFQFNLSGRPDSGDRFEINFNADGSGDNRNALKLVGIELKDVLNQSNGGQTLSESYSEMVSNIGSKTRQVQVNAEASKIVLEQSITEREAISGVNLDEEAARLIKFETAYNAAAQVIRVAQELFDTLISSFR